ncbi:MAG: DUF3048 domain-containing protein [Oscillospiraceae bacterium]
MKKTISIILAVILAAVMFAGCQASSTGETNSISSISTESSVVDIPDDNLNYLTGTYDLADDMVNKRPIAVSVNNIKASWPSYGTSQADILYEMETEGGIPRYMALFSDISDVEQIGSVRSLRDQFIQLVYPFNAVICHIGTSIFADDVLSSLGLWTLNGYYNNSFIFVDQSRVGSYATEHTKFTSGERIYTALEDEGIDLTYQFTDTAFNFVDPEETVVPSTGEAISVTWDFSDSYDGDFRYNETTGKYEKWECGVQQIDAGNNEPLAFENVFLILAPIGYKSGSYLINLDLSTGGTAYYFSEGHYQLCNWTKNGGDFSSNFTFTDALTGSEIQVNPGQSYVAVIRTDYADSVNITAPVSETSTASSSTSSGS